MKTFTLSLVRIISLYLQTYKWEEAREKKKKQVVEGKSWSQ